MNRPSWKRYEISAATRRVVRRWRREVRWRDPSASLDAVRALAQTASIPATEASVRALALQALHQLSEPVHLDAVCAVWADRLGPQPLDQLIIDHAWIASWPPHARVRSALFLQRPEALADDDGEVAEVLVGLADSGGELGRAAADALRLLRAPHAQEEVCRAAVQDGSGPALAAAMAGGFRPRDPGRRAALLFLGGRHEEYAELDYDGALLRAVHAAADAPLRDRLARIARQSGRLDWVGVVTGADRLGKLSGDEWDATASILVEGSRFADLWHLVLVAPPLRSADLLRRIGAGGWTPDDDSIRAACDELVRLARECGQRPVTRQLVPGALGYHAVRALATDPAANLLISGHDKGQIRLWHLPSVEPAGTIAASPGTVTSLAVSPDGRLLAAGGSASLSLRHLPSGRTTGRTKYGQSVTGLGFSPDGTKLISSDGSSTTLWKVPSLVRHRKLLQHETVHNLVVGPGGYAIAAKYRGTTAWILPSGDLVADLPSPAAHGPMAFSNEGRVAAGQDDGTVRVWRLPASEAEATLYGHAAATPWRGAALSALAITPDGVLVASGDLNGKLRVWRLPAAEPITTMDEHPHEITKLAITAGGELLASGDRRGQLRLWHLPSGAEAGVLGELGSEITSLAALPGGELVAGCGDGAVHLWLPRILTIGAVPLDRISPDDVRALRSRIDRSPGERPWIELITALVRLRHQHDIEVGAVKTGSETDIDLGGA